MSGWMDEAPISIPAAAKPAASDLPPAAAGAPHGWMHPQTPVSKAPQALVLMRHAARIAVASAKGGAGKTFVSMSLTALFTRLYQGLKVILVDCDPEYGQLASILGFSPRTTWADFAAMNPADITPNTVAAMLEQNTHPSGFYLLPSPGGVGAMSITLEVAQRVLQALADVFDAVVCDCSDHLTDPATDAALRSATRVLLIMPPDKPAIDTSTRFLDLVQRRGLFAREKFGVVLNRVAPYHPDLPKFRAAIEMEGETLLDGWGIPVLAEIPLDRAEEEARAQGRLSALKPGASSSKALTALVERLTPAATPARRDGLLSGLGRLIKR